MILINHEDYDRVCKKFHAKKVVLVPGIGIDTKDIQEHRKNRDSVREALGVGPDDFMLLSVGELSGRKNHEVIIKAINKLGRSDIKYFVAGKGMGKDNEEEHLRKLIEEFGLGDRVKLLGFRDDAPDLYAAADGVAFPSNREGLGLAGVEAMAAGLPILTSNINGINEYSINGETGFSYSPNDVEGFAEGIAYLADNRQWSREVGEKNIERAKEYDYHIVNDIMKKVYMDLP
jgi:Glycosyltransferase